MRELRVQRQASRGSDPHPSRLEPILKNIRIGSPIKTDLSSQHRTFELASAHSSARSQEASAKTIPSPHPRRLLFHQPRLETKGSCTHVRETRALRLVRRSPPACGPCGKKAFPRMQRFSPHVESRSLFDRFCFLVGGGCEAVSGLICG